MKFILFELFINLFGFRDITYAKSVWQIVLAVSYSGKPRICYAEWRIAFCWSFLLPFTSFFMNWNLIVFNLHTIACLWICGSKICVNKCFIFFHSIISTTGAWQGFTNECLSHSFASRLRGQCYSFGSSSRRTEADTTHWTLLRPNSFQECDCIARQDSLPELPSQEFRK